MRPYSSIICDFFLRSRWNYAFICILTLGLCQISESIFGVRGPTVHDEFAYLLGGEIFSQGHLSKPQHELWPFFEALYVMVKPSYASRFPPAQSAFIAVGYLLGNPIYGVWLSCALLVCSARWMLAAVYRASLASSVTLYCAVHLSLVHYWSCTFWGGSVAAMGGCLAIGAAARFLQNNRRFLDATALGLGLLVLSLSRPFEGFCLGLVLGLALAVQLFRSRWQAPGTWIRFIIPVFALLLCVLAVNAYYNYKVTGDPLLFPYVLWEREYLNIPLFIWDKPGESPEFNNRFLYEFRNGSLLPNAMLNHGLGLAYFVRVWDTATNFIGVGGVLAGLFCVLRFKDLRVRYLLLALGAFSVTLIVGRGFFPHYQAPAFGLYLFAMVFGMQRLRRMKWIESIGKKPFLLLFSLMVVSLFYAGRHRFEHQISGLAPLRSIVLEVLAERGGKYVVIKRDSEKPYLSYDWVYNDADIDQAQVIWARDLGDKNEVLMGYYADREILYLDWGKDVFRLVDGEGETVFLGFDSRTIMR